MQKVTIYTDGACHPNPGKGGWAALLKGKYGKRTHERMISGSEAHTTNNRMELTAVIEALSLLKRPCKVHIVSDSQYVINCAKGEWKRRKNKDLWICYTRAQQGHEITFEWVRGHNGHRENERVDAEAQRQRRILTSQLN